jgi:hypothetical protein
MNILWMYEIILFDKSSIYAVTKFFWGDKNTAA